ncbi:MAG: TIGR03790 family protein [Myxococcota bacterium]
MRARFIVVAAVLSGLTVSPALAVPGPDSVVVVGNASDADSVALAERYVAARAVPRTQLCLLPLPDVVDLSLDDYRTLFQQPLEECLSRGVMDRVDTVLLVRGVPLRVAIPTPEGEERVSLAAALMLWRSLTLDGEPLLGLPPGDVANCGGTPCVAAHWRNPYRSGAFESGWYRETQGVAWQPVLVTMLHGRSYAEAGLLLDSALDAEAKGRGDGEFLLMDGADPARGALDSTYDDVIAGLQARGHPAGRVPFSSELTGRTLAAFFTGTASLGTTIEGNTFAPGALVDNLTSFGAVPENFTATTETQVSVARWIARGAAGIHGTTDEPLNNCFPARALILDYVDGYTLAEAFHRNLPYAYWRNLVLGDPMAAPYANRPEVTLEVSLACAGGAASAHLRASVSDGDVESLTVLVDGAVSRVTTEQALELDLPGQPAQVLVVAQRRDDGTPAGGPRSKGWAAHQITTEALGAACTASEPAPQPEQTARGSGCASVGPAAWGVLVCLAALRRRRGVPESPRSQAA